MLRDSGNTVNPFVHESLGKMPPWTRIANGMNASIEQQHVTTNINRFPGGRTIIPRRVHYPKIHKLGAGIPTLPYGEHQQGYSQVSKNWELLPKPNRHGPMQWHRTPSKRGLRFADMAPGNGSCPPDSRGPRGPKPGLIPGNPVEPQLGWNKIS